ncbi:MAG: hypothetical protein ACUVT1_01830 [Anaerolineae bacterium]
MTRVGVRGRGGRRWMGMLVTAGAYLALALAMTYPLVREFGRAIPGDGFDGWQNYWNLWWMRLALVERGVSPLYTDMLYYPTGVSLAFQTLNPFNGLVSLPIQLTFGLMAAYNSIVLLSFTAGGLGGYLLARDVLARAGWKGTGGRWPAFLAGVVYAFSPFHFAHLLGHMQVFSLEWIPFAMWALWRGLEELDGGKIGVGGWARWVGTAGLFLIFAGTCDWYFGLYLALFSGVLVVYRLAGRRFRWPHLAFLAGVWAVFLLVLAPLWWPMVREASQASFMVPPKEQALALSADLLAFITPNEFHPLWGKWAGQIASRFTSTLSERTVFVGYIPLLLGIWGAVRGRRRSRFWWIGTLFFVVCALGPVLHAAGRSQWGAAGWQIPLPYALLYDGVPVVRIARSIGRYSVMAMAGLGVLAAMGLADWMARRRGVWGKTILPALLVGLVCLEFWSAPYPVSPPDTPAFYYQLAKEPGRFAVLNLPMNWDRPGYLLYQTTHGKPLTAGYISRDDPRTLVYRAPVLQELRFLGRDILCDDVRRLGPSVLSWMGIRYVILDRYKMPGGAEREVTTALAEEMFAGIPPVYEDERLTVYRVEPPAEPQPFAVLGEGWGMRQEEGGRVWRETAGRAVLEIQSWGRTSVQLTILAGADGSAELVLRWPAGREVRRHLSELSETISMEVMTAEGREMELECLGPASCRVYLVQVE